MCSGTVHREQAGCPAQLLLPVPEERLVPLHPVLPAGPWHDIWLPQPHGPKRPLPVRQHTQHLSVWERQLGMTVSWVLEHSHKPFTVRLPKAESSLWAAHTVVFLSSSAMICPTPFQNCVLSPHFLPVNVSRVDTYRGHRVAPPNKEPQPKLLTAHAS